MAELKPAGSCTIESTNEAIKRTQGRDPSFAYGAATVTIEDVANNKITFTARKKGEPPSGAKVRLVADWAASSVMWPCCPSTLKSNCSDPLQDDGENRNRLPAKNARGILFFEATYANANSLHIETPKVPMTGGALTPMRRLEMHPMELKLKARPLADANGPEVEIDLLDSSHVKLSQGIYLSPDRIAVDVVDGLFPDLEVSQPPPGNEADIKATVELLDSSTNDLVAVSKALAQLSTVVLDIREAGMLGEPAEEKIALVRRILKNVTF